MAKLQDKFFNRVIEGDLELDGQVKGDLDLEGSIKADSIIENPLTYTFSKTTSNEDFEISYVYAGVVKNGNKITLAFALTVKKLQNPQSSNITVGKFKLPQEIYDKLYPFTLAAADLLSTGKIVASNSYNANVDVNFWCQKIANREISYGANLSNCVVGNVYYLRIENTFLLSENLAS